jgi:hypothetical protein
MLGVMFGAYLPSFYIVVFVIVSLIYMSIKTYFKSKSIYLKAKENQKKNKFGYKEIESQEEVKQQPDNHQFGQGVSRVKTNEENNSSFITDFDVNSSKQDPIREFSEKPKQFTETKSDIQIPKKLNRKKNSESKLNLKIFQS